MTAPQTPGPAVDPQAAGPGNAVPAPPSQDTAGGAGDAATIVRRFRDSVDEMFELHTEQRLARLAAERERDEARAELEDTQKALAMVLAERNEMSVRAARVPFLAAKTKELDKARAAIERVRAVHVEHGPDGNGLHCCVGCSRLWPCPTVKALDPPGGGT